MKVGIGALAASGRPGVRQSGVHRYAVHLIDALARTLDPGDEMVVYAGRSAVSLPAGAAARIHAPGLPTENPWLRIGWEHARPRSLTRHDGIDLYHGLAFSLPRGLRVPGVVTLHDLAFMRWLDQVPRRRSAYLSWAVRDAAARAGRIVTVSETTKRDAVDLLSVAPDRIDVTPLGVDPSMRRSSPEAVARFGLEEGLDRPFVLAVGNLEPRKNLPALIEAFASIARQVPHDLVLAGAEGWRNEALRAVLANPAIEGRVRLEGFVPPERLPLWYSACDIYAIPSLYEGFGLPLLEAMACGAPSLASTRGALPEVAGDAALLVDPDPDSIASGLLHLIEDEALRERLAAGGPAHAASFTWERTAALTLETYRKALA
jgi:glycosyltransferase involved in cell wall biosynthesis